MKLLFQSFLASCACPVKLLKSYLTKLQIPPDSRDLRSIFTGYCSGKLVALDKSISYGTIRGAFKRDLKSVGVDSSKFGLHYSLRPGGATMAASNGVSDRLFQRHVRWKSVQAKDTYVDDDLSQRLEVSKFLGLWGTTLHAGFPNSLSLYKRFGFVSPGPPKKTYLVKACVVFCCSVETKYVISDVWARWNNYFVGTRYREYREPLVVIQGYIRPGIIRGGHLGLRTNHILRFVNFCLFSSFSDVVPWLVRLFYFCDVSVYGFLKFRPAFL